MDTVSVRGVWSNEANIEANEVINKISYIAGINGENTRTLKNEAYQTIFALTKD